MVRDVLSDVERYTWLVGWAGTGQELIMEAGGLLIDTVASGRYNRIDRRSISEWVGSGYAIVVPIAASMSRVVPLGAEPHRAH